MRRLKACEDVLQAYLEMVWIQQRWREGWHSIPEAVESLLWVYGIDSWAQTDAKVKQE